MKIKQSLPCLLFPNPIKPISFKGKYFKRVHNANHLVDLNEIANEHLKTINLSWDFSRDPNHGIKDISLEKVNQFIENANHLRDYPINDDPLTVLKNLNCCERTPFLLVASCSFVGVPL